MLLFRPSGTKSVHVTFLNRSDYWTGREFHCFVAHLQPICCESAPHLENSPQINAHACKTELLLLRFISFYLDCNCEFLARCLVVAVFRAAEGLAGLKCTFQVVFAAKEE